jgi:selenocysteine lyase/cysteine desulfurase
LIDRLRVIEVGAASVMAGSDFARIELELKPDASRWECGTLNFGGIAALAASLELLTCLPNVAERIFALTNSICERVRRAGLKVFSSREGEDWSGIVSIDAGNRNVAALAKRCKEAGIVVNNRGGRLRISPHVYNNEGDIERLVDVISKPE